MLPRTVSENKPFFVSTGSSACYRRIRRRNGHRDRPRRPRSPMPTTVACPSAIVATRVVNAVDVLLPGASDGDLLRPERGRQRERHRDVRVVRRRAPSGSTLPATQRVAGRAPVTSSSGAGSARTICDAVGRGRRVVLRRRLQGQHRRARRPRPARPCAAACRRSACRRRRRARSARPGRRRTSPSSRPAGTVDGVRVRAVASAAARARPSSNDSFAEFGVRRVRRLRGRVDAEHAADVARAVALEAHRHDGDLLRRPRRARSCRSGRACSCPSPGCRRGPPPGSRRTGCRSCVAPAAFVTRSFFSSTSLRYTSNVRPLSPPK